MHTTSPFFKAFKLQYYQAFLLYQKGLWQEALEEFNDCLKIRSHDGPSLALRNFAQSQLQGST